MGLIQWNDQFATGIASIDHEHAELISLINFFYSKLTQPSNKNELVDILNNIYAAIHAHFMLEEKIMKKNAYDEYEKHRDDHAHLLDDIRDIAIELDKSAQFDGGSVGLEDNGVLSCLLIDLFRLN